MKIAVASEEKDLDSEISGRGGRAPFYLVFEDGKIIETIKNPFVVGGGAGYGVAGMLAKKKVDKVIAGKFGDNMKEALKGNDIDLKEKQGIVKKIMASI